jgi:peptide/nickel transport system permease protein
MPPLLALTIRRGLWLIPTLIGLMVLTFVIAHVIPADPAGLVAGDTATPQQVAAVRHDLGLDQPIWRQFLDYAGAMLRGDLGTSLYTRRPIAQDLLARLPATLELTLFALVIAVMGGVPLGVVAGYRHGSVTDHAIRIGTVACFAVASFWLALMLQLLFAMQLRWLPLAGLPAGGSLGDLLTHVTLPAVALALPIMATLVRFARAGMLDVLGGPSFSYQRAMGVPGRVTLWRYALRHALVAVVTQAGLSFGALLAGSVVIETIFNWPGVGSYAYGSIIHADYPAVMGFVLWSGVAFVLVNFVIDVLLALIDPRVLVQ